MTFLTGVRGEQENLQAKVVPDVPSGDYTRLGTPFPSGLYILAKRLRAASRQWIAVRSPVALRKDPRKHY